MSFPAFIDTFPLQPNSKIPKCKWAVPLDPPHRFEDGETYGLPTGPRNGVWVLDIDRKNGVDGLRSLIAYTSENGVELPDTLTVQTPSGGLHLYFAWDDTRPIGNRVGLLPGVDIRGKGGFVAAGERYPVAVDAPVADAPEWLTTLVGTRVEAPAVEVSAIGPEHPEWAYRVREAEKFLASAPPCIQGQNGSGQLWKVSLRLSRTYELPVDKSLELLAPYNARCVPPWDETDLRRHLTRTATHGTGPTGTAPEGWVLVATPAAAMVTVAPGGAWRRMNDPKHTYDFDLAQEVAGGANKQQAYSQKEITAAITGPAASPVWRGVWQRDLFRRRVIAVNPPMPLEAETVGLTRADLSKMQIWYACMGIKASIDQIEAAIEVAAECARFHPVRDYLHALPTMTIADADAYFQGIAARLWGAHGARDVLESAQLRRMVIAAVRRVKKPGTKVDTMLILAGAQGYNKSRFCAHLFGEFFRDQMPPLDLNGGRDASIALEGYWGIEFAELVSINRSQEAVKKEFLTRYEDKYRPPYGKTTLVQPRECVFVGTTNEDDFLKDATGDTRYEICEIEQPIDLLFSREEFWAAASALEAAGERHYIARLEHLPGVDGESAMAIGLARHQDEDPWTDAVLKYCRTRKETWVTASLALTYGVPISVDKQRDYELIRVKRILRRHYGKTEIRWIDERSQRVYAIPKSD